MPGRGSQGRDARNGAAQDWIHAGPFVGVSQSQFFRDLVNFGDKCPRNGSTNNTMVPRTTLECPHEGPRVVGSDRRFPNGGGVQEAGAGGTSLLSLLLSCSVYRCLHLSLSILSLTPSVSIFSPSLRLSLFPLPFFFSLSLSPFLSLFCLTNSSPGSLPPQR